MFGHFGARKNITQEMEKIAPGELNVFLDRFYAEVKAKNGEDYEPDSLRVMVAALDRLLKDHSYVTLLSS